CRFPPQRAIGEDWIICQYRLVVEASFMRRDHWLSRLLSVRVVRAEILLAGLLISADSASAQSDPWVPSWTTAQQLVGSTAAPPGGGQRGGRGGGPVTNLPASFSDET